MDYESLMRKALSLAEKGLGRTSPNPPVGALLVKDGEIIAEGYHRKAGTDHAEEIVIDKAGKKAEGSTLIVTLEPCNVPGKKRNCTEKIISSNIGEVVIGTLDPNPLVNGRGIERLKEAGVEAKVGLLREESDKLIESFSRFIKTGIPFVVCKWAMSADGKIATRTGESQWISNQKSRNFDHLLRNRYDSILIGAGTAITDDPRLTCRIEGGRNPVRVIVGGKREIPGDLTVFTTEDDTQTILAVMEKTSNRYENMSDTKDGVELLTVKDDGGLVDLFDLLEKLGERNVMSVLVEGGSEILGYIFDRGLADKVHIFISPIIIGGNEAYTAVGGEGVSEMKESIGLKKVDIDEFDDDIMLTGYVRN